MKKDKSPTFIGKRMIAIMLVLILMFVLLQINVYAEETGRLTIINVDAITERAAFDETIISANHRFNTNGFGMYDEENGKVYDDFTEKTAQVNYNLIRYPAGTIGNLFKWKDSIGDVSNRKTVVLANASRKSELPTYGLDEHMTYVESIGANAIYMLAEASETPQDAADLIEYLLAPNDGRNINGGIDWAAERAKNGHEEPYDVKYFEIGNELSAAEQRYWLNYPSLTGKTTYNEKYALGDRVNVTNEPARKYGTWVDNESTGEANQELFSQYYPVQEGSEIIYVNGNAWTRVSNFLSCSSSDKVYVMDYSTGKITFGDGIHGMIPQKGARVRMDYVHVHAGFEAYYDAMKNVANQLDKEIVILSCLSDIYTHISDKSKCDGIVNHIYLASTSGETEQSVYDSYMIRADTIIDKLCTNRDNIITAAGRNNVISATTEYGIIGINNAYSNSKGDNEGRDEARMLGRGLHIASILIGAAQTEQTLLIHQGFTAFSFGGGTGLGSAGNVYNALYAQNPNSMDTTIESAMALAYKMFGNGHGDTVLNSFVENNPTVGTYNSYNALRLLASKDDDGTVFLFVVNRDSTHDIESLVKLNGYTCSGEADISVMNGDTFYACNTPDHPNDVSITCYKTAYSGSNITFTFPAHSITVIKLNGSEIENAHVIERHIDFDASLIPADITVKSGNVSVVSENGENVLSIQKDSNNGSVIVNLGNNGTTFGGLVKVSLDFKATNVNSRMNVSLKSDGAILADMSYDNGRLMCNTIKRLYCTENEWHKIEFIIDTVSREYMIYVDGSYANSKRSYATTSKNFVTTLQFDVENGKTAFYIDNIVVQSLSSNEGSLVGSESINVKTERGIAATMPSNIKLVWDDGTYRTYPVSWNMQNELDYGKTGVYEVVGNVSDEFETVRAYVTVSERKIIPTSLSVETLPNKLSYKHGEELDLTGIKLSLYYSDGIIAHFSEGFEVSANLAKSGLVTVSAAGLNASFTVSISANPLKIIAVIMLIIAAALTVVVLIIGFVRKKTN